jgi:hypothetical protein
MSTASPKTKPARTPGIVPDKLAALKEAAAKTRVDSTPQTRALALAARVGWNPATPSDLSSVDFAAVVAEMPEVAAILVAGVEEEIKGPLTADQLDGVVFFLERLCGEVAEIAGQRAKAAK